MKEEQRQESFHGAERPHVTSETWQNSDSDGIDLIELLLCLRAGIDTKMMLAGLSLGLAVLSVRYALSDRHALLLAARAPAGVKISVTQSVITLTMHGSRATTSR